MVVVGLICVDSNRIKLMTEVGIDDFSIRDLIKPEAGRVKKILSAVINFAKFREERMPVFETHAQKAVCKGHDKAVYQTSLGILCL